MSTTLPGLTIPITGDLSKLSAAFTKASTAAKKMATTVEGPLNKMRSGINSVGTAAAKFIAPVAAAAGAIVSFQAVMGAFEKADTLGKMSKALGISVEKLSQLNYVAELSQGSAEGMNTALKHMEQFLGKAAEGGAEASSTLRSLNLNLKDFAGLSPDEAFMKLADAMKGINDQGSKTQAMSQVFGRNFKEIAGTVDLGSKGIKEMAEQGAALNRTLSATDFAKMMSAKDAMESLGKAVEAVTNRLAIALAPVMRWVSTEIDKWIGNVSDFDSTFNTVAESIVKAIGVVRLAWQGLTLLWDGAKVVVAGLSVAFWDAMMGVSKAVLFVWGEIKNWFEATQNGFKVVAAALNVGWESIKYAAVKAFAWITEGFGKMIKNMGEAAGASGLDIFGDIATKAANAGAALEIEGKKMGKVATAGLKDAVSDLKDSAGEWVDSIKKFGEMPDTSTPYFEAMSDNAHKFLADTKQALSDTAYAMASQFGGNAYTSTLHSFEASTQEASDKVTAIAADAAQQRAVISQNAANQQMAIAEMAQGAEVKSWEDHWIDLLQRKQDALDELDLITTDNQTIQQARQEAFNAEQELEEQKHIDAQVQLWNSGAMGKMAAIGGILNNLASLMQSKNKTLFQIGKVAALSQNVIDTIQSAASSFKFGCDIGGPPVGYAFAATAVAAGMVRAQQLMSTQYGGGGGGVSSGGGGGGASAAESASNAAAKSESRNMNVTLYGDSFNATQVRGLISAINDQAGDNMSIKIQGGGK